MASCRMSIAWLAPLALLLLASRSSAQTIPVTISAFGFGSQVLLYGQAQTYTATLTVPSGSPVPQGNLQFVNQTTILSTASLATSGTSSGTTLTVSFVDSAAADVLPAGLYSAYHAVYPGFNSSTSTWGATDSSNTPLADGIFQVLPASVGLAYKATPFTLANFTSSLIVVATNVNATNQVPQGVIYETITNSNTGALITNSSLVLTNQDANTITGKLPASFNATASLKAGTYQATFTYFPTSNFTQPIPLVVLFQIVDTTPTLPPPPPPGGAVPAPPPPPGGVTSPTPITPPTPVPPTPVPPTPSTGSTNTTIVLEVFYEEGKKGLLKLDCTGSSLVYTAAVRGPSATQIPTTGSISFLVLPSGVTVGSAAVTADATSGFAYATIVGPAPQSAIYGQYTVVASYSGSADGVYAPAKASAVLNLSASCGKHGDLLNTVDSVVQYVDGETADGVAANNAYQTPVTGATPDPYGQAAYVGK